MTRPSNRIGYNSFAIQNSEGQLIHPHKTIIEFAQAEINKWSEENNAALHIWYFNEPVREAVFEIDEVSSDHPKLLESARDFVAKLNDRVDGMWLL